MTTTSDVKCDDIQESKKFGRQERGIVKTVRLHVDSNPCYFRVVVKYNQPGSLLLNMVTF